MTWRIPTLALAAALLTTGAAMAADVKGAITAVDPVQRTMTVNGIRYSFPPGVDMAGLAAGQTVTVTFTDQNGTNMVSKVAK